LNNDGMEAIRHVLLYHLLPWNWDTSD